ncbi:MAG: hypothetical protein LUH42_08425 [Oscillospiraceae bacterium]|nr:hypothetical protein [Oscillospiraceae bacterium]
MELEIDRGGEYDDHASRLIDLGNTNEERTCCRKETGPWYRKSQSI